MENKEITLKLNVREINIVLNLVAKGSYDVVAGLIGKIQNQASEQLKEEVKE